MYPKKITLLGTLLFSAWTHTPALATYSIAATEVSSGQMGAAVTSCIQGNSLDRVYASSAQRGVVLAQALSYATGRDQAKRLLDFGYSASEAIGFITTRRFDPNFESRQYAVVSFEEARAFTGRANNFYANQITASTPTLNYAVQGNLLTGPEVLLQAQAAIVESKACDLAERLLEALEAGAENAQGDARCRPFSPSDAALLRVDNFFGEPVIDISIAGSTRPIKALRERFEIWRRQNPCR